MYLYYIQYIVIQYVIFSSFKEAFLFEKKIAINVCGLFELYNEGTA